MLAMVSPAPPAVWGTWLPALPLNVCTRLHTRLRVGGNGASMGAVARTPNRLEATGMNTYMVHWGLSPASGVTEVRAADEDGARHELARQLTGPQDAIGRTAAQELAADPRFKTNIDLYRAGVSS